MPLEASTSTLERMKDESAVFLRNFLMGVPYIFTAHNVVRYCAQ